MEFIGHHGLKTRAFVWINMGFTFFACILILMRQTFLLQYKKLCREVEQSDSLASSGLMRKVYLEWLLLLIQPYPWFIGRRIYFENEIIGHDIYYYVNDFLQLISLVRYFYLISAFLHLTKWRSASAVRIW